MSFKDVLDNKLIEELNDVSIPEILVAVSLACILGIFIVLIYKLTFSGVVFNRSFAVSLVLLSMVTALVVLCISSNIVLSLGMVGALSIVRFRTAVKEVTDTVFMFWAITAGIVTGAGFILVAIVASVFIGLLYVLITCGGNLLDKSGFSPSKGYLVSLIYDSQANGVVANCLSSLPKHKVKSHSMADGYDELVIELKMDEKQIEMLRNIKNVRGVQAINIISHTGSGSSIL